MSLNFTCYEIKRVPTKLPTPSEFCVEKNDSYAASLLAGVISPLVHLPQILFFGSIWPFVLSLGKGIAFIGLSMYAGFLGKASGYRTTEVTEAAITPERKQKVLDEMLQGSGFKAVRIE